MVSINAKLLICVLFFLPYLVFSQEGMIHGKVTNLEYEPLPGVTVVVKGTDVGTVTDIRGEFHVRAKKGDILMFSFIGMKSKEVEILGETLIEVLLQDDDTVLDEVVVIFKRPIVEAEKGKTTFNVDQIATNSGISALEMLKKIPGLGVDPTNQITWRGASGIEVMIDGKRSYLSGNQLALYLEGISALDVEKVELISNPSAAYESEGNAGLINIVTKKNKTQGYTINVRSSLSKGKFWMNNQNISGSINKGVWNAYATFDYNTPHRFSANESANTLVENGESISLERQNEVPFRVFYYTWKAGGDWEFAPKHRVGIHYHGYFDDFSGDKISDITKKAADGSLTSSVHSRYELVEPYHYDAITMDYHYDIDSIGKKISTGARYISYRNFSDGMMEGIHYDADGKLLYTNTLRIHQPGFISIKSAQIDADLPFPEFFLKAGLKYAETDNDNNFRTEQKEDDKFIVVPEITNHFKYKERVSAAYLSTSKTLGKWEVQAGVRLERTQSNSFLIDSSFNNKWDYTSLFPNLSMSYLPSDRHRVDLAISRRINRPAYSSLNPIRWYNDEYFYFYGNPSLIPEIGWLLSTSYTLMGTFVFSAEYSHRNNYISQQLSIDDNGVSVRSQSANFSHFDRLDINLLAPFNPTDFWDVQFFGSLNYTTYAISDNNKEQQLERWSSMVSMQHQVRFLQNYSMDATVRYSTGELQGVYLTKDLFFTDLGIKRSMMDNKLEATFTVTDVFNTYRLYGDSQSAIIDYYYRDKPDSRRFTLSIRYLLGGHLFKEKSTKTEEENRL